MKQASKEYRIFEQAYILFLSSLVATCSCPLHVVSFTSAVLQCTEFMPSKFPADPSCEKTGSQKNANNKMVIVERNFFSCI